MYSAVLSDQASRHATKRAPNASQRRLASSTSSAWLPNRVRTNSFTLAWSEVTVPPSASPDRTLTSPTAAKPLDDAMRFHCCRCVQLLMLVLVLLQSLLMLQVVRLLYPGATTMRCCCCSGWQQSPAAALLVELRSISAQRLYWRNHTPISEP
eukprot:501330-Pleurochrysis_carterae.AAC.1